MVRVLAGWYNGRASQINASWRAHAAWVAEHWPAKPFIISETGAGGIAGNHSDNATDPARWSEEYQQLVDSLDVATAMNCSNVSGIALWQCVHTPRTRRRGGQTERAVMADDG